MGDIVSGLFGGGGGDAASDAGAVQLQATREGIAFQKEALEKQIKYLTESRDLSRADLQPFRDVGTTDLQGLADLVTNPTKQAEFISNNPFFDALQKKASTTLMNNQAAKGKLASGGTAEALQNSLLLLGNDFLTTDINRRQNLATMGSNAASGQASATLNTGSNIANATQNSGNAVSDLITQGGNAQAAGIVGKANAKSSAMNNLIQTGLTAWSLSDKREKEDIHPVGEMSNGVPIYAYRYKGQDRVHIGPMAQEVEDIKPEAVMEHNGRKYVNMEQVWQ